MVHILELRIELRDNRLIMAGDGDNPELDLGIHGRNGFDEFGDLHVEDRRVFVNLENGQLEFTAGKVHRIGRSRMTKEIDNFVTGDFFGAEE